MTLESRGWGGVNTYEHRCHTARARYTRRNGLLVVDYTGPITIDTMEMFERRLLPDRRACSAAIERLDTAIILFTGPARLASGCYPLGTPPSAVIVPHDQMQQAKEFCAMLGRLGVIRTAWLPEHHDIARRWCEAIGS